MRRPGRTALGLVLAGIALMVAGFLWSAVFAGIPYQDPTPELAAAYARNEAIGSASSWAGVATVATGVVWGLVRRLLRRRAS